MSGHGFGHATRSFEVIHAVRRLSPKAHLVIRSSVPRWFIERSLGSDTEISPARVDVGVIQIDSLELDDRATAKAAGEFYSDLDRLVDTEAAWLRSVRADIVVADVPPLAFAAAGRIGIPAVAVANFTWDWIYEIYPAFAVVAPHVIPAIQEAYRHATLALRLPFYGGFEPMRHVVRDIPLIARRSRRGRADVRKRLALEDDRPVVLASFGGHGAALPYEAIAASGNFTLVITEYEVSSAATAAPTDRLRRLTSAELDAGDLRYEDLVAAADVVVSKPGYGIVSECIANGSSLLYTSRGHFAEYDVMVQQMPSMLRSRFISQDDVRRGRWAEGIEALLAQPEVGRTIPCNGAAIAAEAILQIVADTS